MKIFFHIWWREVSAYFRTSMAYVTGFFFLAVAGFGFWNATARWAQAPSPGHFANGLFGSVWYWLAMLVVTPLLAMRLFAEENRTGTLETLLAAPVTETTIVLAKFASAFSLFLLLWAPTLAYGFLLRHCGAQYPAMPWGWVAAGYFGTALVGAFFLAIALFCSLWTRHQMAAAMAGLGALGILLALGFIPVHASGIWSCVAQAAAPTRHMQDFTAGIVDTRHLIWYVSATALVLFMTIRVLEARRLR
jgi:ABC-2 type transport system permease protein